MEGLAEQPIGTWALRRSRFGSHLVRVDEVEAAHAADFESVRDDVRGMWLDDRRDAGVADEIAALRARWNVVGKP